MPLRRSSMNWVRNSGFPSETSRRVAGANSGTSVRAAVSSRRSSADQRSQRQALRAGRRPRVASSADGADAAAAFRYRDRSRQS